MEWLIQLLAGFVSDIIGTKNTLDANEMNAENVEKTNMTNAQIAEKTNEANLKIARETNAANAEQAELAYERSKPITQVANMRAAGMSLPAAIQSLSGGGTYTAPVMQGATMQGSHAESSHFERLPNNLGALIERFATMPANVTQVELNNQALESARQEYVHRQNAERRAQQEHDMKMDEMLYNKWERENMNNFMGLMTSVAHDKNIEPDENESFHKFIRRLGLQDNAIYRKLPISAHERVFNYYKQQLQEQRDAISAQDKHNIDAQTFADMRARAADYKAESNARKKEYKLRELQADARTIAAQMEYDTNRIERDFKFTKTKDGRITMTPHAGISAVANEFWKTIGSIVGVDYVGDVLAGLIRVPVK